MQERNDVMRSFGSHLWVEVAPHRWLAAGSARLVEEVVDVIGDGKEATIYCCRADEHLEASWMVAKVYRAQKFRAFNNTSRYLDAGEIRDRRQRRAVQKKTRAGRGFAHHVWIEREWDTLNLLYEAGADIPEPYAHSADAILMEYVGEPGEVAPLLLRVELEGAELREAFETLLENIELFLACDRIHGDLSAYNVLWWEGRPKIIDLPQAVPASGAPDAYALLRRDVHNICRYFERAGLRTDAGAIAERLWKRWLRGEL